MGNEMDLQVYSTVEEPEDTPFRISTLRSEIDTTWMASEAEKAARWFEETKIEELRREIERSNSRTKRDTTLRYAAYKDLQRAQVELKQRETELWVAGTASQRQSKLVNDEEYRRTVLERVLERKQKSRMATEERKLKLEVQASVLRLHMHQENCKR